MPLRKSPTAWARLEVRANARKYRTKVGAAKAPIQPKRKERNDARRD